MPNRTRKTPISKTRHCTRHSPHLMTNLATQIAPRCATNCRQSPQRTRPAMTKIHTTLVRSRPESRHAAAIINFSSPTTENDDERSPLQLPSFFIIVWKCTKTRIKSNQIQPQPNTQNCRLRPTCLTTRSTWYDGRQSPSLLHQTIPEKTTLQPAQRCKRKKSPTQTPNLQTPFRINDVTERAFACTNELKKD